jgi:hypothetical protein
MRRKLVAIAAMAATAFAVMPMESALAAHHIGGYARKCIGTDNKAYNGVDVAVDGVGSDQPLNYYAAGVGRVTGSTLCAVTNGIKVLRVQIDNLYLLELVGTKRVIRAQTGRKNNGTNSITAQTPGVHRGCTANYQVSVHFSVRYVDGATSSGGYLIGPVFRRC